MHLSLLLGLISSPVFAFPAAPAPSSGGDLSRVAVDIVHDAGLHGAFLDELAELRRSGRAQDFRARLELEQTRQGERRAGVRARIEALGVEVVDERWLVPTLLVEGPASALAHLSEVPGVVAVTRASQRVPASLQVALDPAHHDAVGANQLTIGGEPIVGTGVVVAVIDSGIDVDVNLTGKPHKAYYENADTTTNAGGIGGSRILSAENVSEWSPSHPEDFHGHGSRMASIVAGAKFNNFPGVSDGPAPNALIRSYRIDDDFVLGLASTWSMENGFQEAAAQPDVRVANMSYDGTIDYFDKPNAAIDAAGRTGLVITLSAGNDGSANSFFHSAYNCLPVGAADLQAKEPFNEPANFISAIGPLPDGRTYPRLIAVGENLTSVLIDNEVVGIGSYGTSGAAAITAGTAALVLQANPALTAHEVRALLINSSEEVTSGNPDARGFGYLNSKSAVEAALAGLTLPVTSTAGIFSTFEVVLAEDESFAATLVWDYLGFGNQPSDLDLTLISPDGLTIASSTSGFDNVEHVRAIAPVAGTYTVRVDVLDIEPSAADIDYALATTVPALPSGGGDPCPGAAFAAEVQQDGAVDGPQDPFAVKGCGLTSVTSVTVAGVPANFGALSDQRMTVELPAGVPVGAQPVVVSSAANSATSSVNVGVSAPRLDAHYVIGSTPSDELTFTIADGEPGEAYAVFYSFSQGASHFPGVIDLAIGAAVTDLYLLHGPDVLSANGADFQNMGLWPTPNPPAGVKVYTQAAVHSSAAGGDWIPSNTDSTIVIF